MFTSVRWRLTFWFVTITTIVYALSTLGAVWLFRAGLTNLYEDEIKALEEEILPAINLNSGKPNMQEWANTAHRTPFRALPTIQLYDAAGKLIEQHGPPGVVQLYKDEGEVEAELPNKHVFKVYSVPLTHNKDIVGYLQLQLSLATRDKALTQFAITMASVSPFLLISLIVAGYFFSSKAAQPLEDSLVVLRRFMTDAGHELSTPISIIQVNAEAMEPEIETSEYAMNKLQIIFRAAERMGSLVQDLMLLSKMESPQLEKRMAPLEFDKIVKNVCEEFLALFAAKHISLSFQKLAPTAVYGEADSLKRLITNMLQNALRYTDSGGSVDVSLEPSGRTARLKVQDTGVGIPPESLPSIYDRFYRVEKSRSRAEGGAGLGLSIVRAIVDAHKARIEVQSEVGKGTTFTVVFPVR